jgi:hypothetical protein
LGHVRDCNLVVSYVAAVPVAQNWVRGFSMRERIDISRGNPYLAWIEPHVINSGLYYLYRLIIVY